MISSDQRLNVARSPSATPSMLAITITGSRYASSSTRSASSFAHIAETRVSRYSVIAPRCSSTTRGVNAFAIKPRSRVCTGIVEEHAGRRVTGNRLRAGDRGEGVGVAQDARHILMAGDRPDITEFHDRHVLAQLREEPVRVAREGAGERGEPAC